MLKCELCGADVNSVQAKTLPAVGGGKLDVCHVCERHHQRYGHVGEFESRLDLLPLLTNKQREVLQLLPANVDEIVVKVWPDGMYEADVATAQTTICHMRRRLEMAGVTISQAYNRGSPYKLIETRSGGPHG